MAYLYFSAVILISFFITAFLYLKTVELSSKFFPNLYAENLIFAVPIIVFCPQMFLLRNLGNSATDVLFYPENIYLFAVTAGSLLVGACSLFEKLNKVSFLFLAAACWLSAYLLPYDFSLYGLEIEPIYQKYAVGVSWFFIAIGCYFFSRQEGLLSEFVILFSLIMLIFYILSGISLIQLLYAAAFLGISSGYLLYNWKPAQINMNIPSALSFGFLFGFLVVGCSAEGLWLPTQIIVSYLYVAMAMYFLQKTSFIENNERDKNEVVFCIQIMPILAIIAIFQMYATTTKTIYIVAVMILLWLRNRYFFKKKSFKEINNNVVENIKTSIDDLRNFLDKK